MSALTSTGFYVQKPGDEYWNTAILPSCVIEAGPIDISERGLEDWQKTDEYVQNHLKVIHPKDFAWTHVEKSKWVKCLGPSRKLTAIEYVRLYHSLDPARPLPKGWTEHKSNI